ncbi:MAG: hypothetical protein U5K31_12705 [Balneolaceae bacterium]|nr:hypothetical protein [Balneolaceae bacterium]
MALSRRRAGAGAPDLGDHQRTADRQAAASIQQAGGRRPFPTSRPSTSAGCWRPSTDFIDQISFAIQFMALFSILTGLIVLASSVATSRYQRIRRAPCLRTTGRQQGADCQNPVGGVPLPGLLSALTGLHSLAGCHLAAGGMVLRAGLRARPYG